MSQVVAAPELKLREKVVRPVRLVHFIGIVEKAADPFLGRQSREGLVEGGQVALDRSGGEVIDDVAFAAGSGALHLLAGPAPKQRIHGPPASRRAPVQASLRIHVPDQVERLPIF